MNSPKILRNGRSALRFCLFFLVWLALLALLFDQAQPFFSTTFMYPVSVLAAWLLDAIGVRALLDAAPLTAGFCDLTVGGITYRIIHECTGIFALLTFLALILAFPSSPSDKIQGALLGIPAFYAYSIFRLVVLGVVAHLQPAWVQTFHQHMMVLVNVGFLFALWFYWTVRVVEHGE